MADSSFQVATDDRSKLKMQGQLARWLRQSCVLLKFKEPISRSRTGEFLLIRLSEFMKQNGEGRFYKVDIFQPHRAGRQICPACRQVMARISESTLKCVNAKCDNFQLRNRIGPCRGVVKVLTFPDFVVDTQRIHLPPDLDGKPQWRDVEYVNACVLVLDRRYKESVLAGIYRTAGILCEQNRWKLAH